ncbi:Uncharacterised protein [Mycobacterium tuberculosis]|uniref:Uncharacterized protein n=1 Tax=Mycobacterium tuberculosis TaxID=1773 RepID=A0A916LBD9_MYCTX|nr:Uncharacterised protein [Mycobacterium tuberculosis]COY33712.1 Uncharacterised protein [Mycobacterium tuberculosis]COZ98791.1 Uncharacterised protein [Mycobacterium tuberculosis]CPA82153.1 Uncharacterised protein [Mycobacterium tuberculosis]
MPEPLGPIKACVSPDFTVRSTPRRIGISWSASAGFSTLTCRSLISKMVMRLLSFPLIP